MPYSSRHSDTIARLITQQGQAAADARLNSGAAWGQAIQGIGQTVDRSLAGLIRQREEAPRRAYESAKMKDDLDQIEARKVTQAENAALGKLLHGALTQDPKTGRQTVDRVRFFGSVPPELQHRLTDITAMLDQVDPPGLALQRDQFDADQAERSRVADRQASADRRVTNADGVRRLIGESVAARGGQPFTPAERQTYQGMALQEGVELPSVITEDPEADAKRAGLMADATARAQARYRTREPERIVPVTTVEDGREVTKYLPESQVVGRTFERPAASGGMGAAAAQTRNARAAAALNSIQRLKALAPERMPGPIGIAQGAAEVAKGYVGLSTKTRQFQALIQPTAMQMAAAIQGAANLSDNERKAMAEMLGSIGTMDYETQMALLDSAADLVSSGADVEKVGDNWRPMGRLTGGTGRPAVTVAGDAYEEYLARQGGSGAR